VPKQLPGNLLDARPGHVDHHLSPPFQRLVHPFPHVLVEEGQRSVPISVDYDPVQIKQFPVTEHDHQRFLHGIASTFL